MKVWIVPKGFIALDGMSLTIQSISGNTFAIALVPITEELTIADKYKVGDKVNLEADIITKTAVNYLEVSQCNKTEDLV
jgi:riboflavin synthase alpha subunit